MGRLPDEQSASTPDHQSSNQPQANSRKHTDSKQGSAGMSLRSKLGLFFKGWTLHPDSTDLVPVYKGTVSAHGSTLCLPLPKQGIEGIVKSILVFLCNLVFCFKWQVIVDISKKAMSGKNNLKMIIKIHDKSGHLSRNIEDEWLEPVAPSIELTGENGGDIVFKDFVKITVPHNMAPDQIRFTEVLQTHNGEINSLPTLLECHPEHVDAFFTVDTEYVTIYTKSFSQYACSKGHTNRLNMRAWVFGSHDPSSKEIEFRIITATNSPKKLLLHDEVLKADKIVYEHSETVNLSRGSLTYRAKDVVAFALQIKNNEWEKSPAKKSLQVKDLENIIACSRCNKKQVECPPDAAVFHVKCKETAEISQIFEGVMHIVLKLPHSFCERMQKRFNHPLFKEGNPDVKEWMDNVEEDNKHGITSFEIRIDLANPPPDLVIAADTPELTDEMLLILSKNIADRTQLNALGIQGLKLKDNVVATHVTNNKDDITMAAHDMLKEWRRSQCGGQVAYKKLSHALKNADMPSLINTCLTI